VEVYAFVRWLLVVAVTVSVIWPLNVPLAALAYKVRNGPRPLPLEPGPFWMRSTFAGLGLAGLAVLVVLLDTLLCQSGIPAGVVHIVVLLLYAPAAVWFLFWVYALDEMPQGAGVLLLFVFLPGLPLGLLQLIGFELPLSLAGSWLAPVT
jgi:hypothetical protein